MPPSDRAQRQQIDQTQVTDSSIQQTQGGQNTLSFQNSHHNQTTIQNVIVQWFAPKLQPQVDWGWAKRILEDQQTEVYGRLKYTLMQQQQLYVELQEQPQQVGLPYWETSGLEFLETESVELEATQELLIADKAPERLPPDKLLIEVFGRPDIKGKLLILGAPGAGKTTQLLSLAEQLVFGALQTPETTIPIIFELSTWKDDRQSIQDWLVEQLYDNYGGDRKLKRYETWLNQRVLLPLMDGLDELGLERQIKCVQKLNEFAQHYPQVVVCCRTKEYETAYETAAIRLDTLRGAVCLQPLSDSQIQDYLTRINRSLLWKALQESPEMQRLLEPQPDEAVGLLRVPLFLSIAARVYDPQQPFDSKADLLEKYIDRQLSIDTRRSDRRRKEVKGRSWAYKTPGQEPDWRDTRDRLGWLARKLEENYQVDLLIEEMQPSWLDTPVQKRQYRLIVGLIVGLICVLSELFFGLKDKPIDELYRDPINYIDPMEAFGISMLHVFVLLFVLLFGLIGMPITMLLFVLLSGLLFGMSSGLFFGLFSGLFFGLYLGVMDKPTFELFFVLFFGLIFGMILGLRKELKLRSKPNQGIWNSLRGMVFATVFSYPLAVFFANSVPVIRAIEEGKSIEEWVAIAVQSLPKSLIYGALTALFCAFFAGGGLAFVQHFCLRFVLARSGAIPWNLVAFLNYGVERRLLQGIGGRYRFIHRELLTHFAQSSAPSQSSNSGLRR